MREPLLAPLAGLSAGIVLSRLTEFELVELLPGLSLLALLACCAARYDCRRAFRLCLVVILVLAGILVDLLHREGPPPIIEASARETVVIEGCVVEPSVFHEGRERFVAELAPRSRAIINLYYADGEEPLTLRYGQRVDITGRIRRPRNFQNPGAFDYEGFLARRDIFWTISVSGPTDLERLPGTCGSPFWGAIFRVRSAALDRLQRLYPDSPRERALLRAILLGESSQLEPAWKENFRQTGTYHTLVISGLHLTVLVAFLHLILRLVPLPFGWRIMLTISSAWFYAFLTGCNTPVLRAAAGLTLFLVASWFFRRRRLLNIIAAIAIIFLVCDPDQLFDASFHLSFLAVALIAAFAVPFLEATTIPYTRALAGLADDDRDLHLPPQAAQFRLELRLLAETVLLWTRLPPSVFLAAAAVLLRIVFHLAELVVVSAVIQVGLALPMIVNFHRVPFAGLLANPLIVPLMSFAVPAGFLAILSGWALPAWVAGRLVSAAVAVVAWFAGWEASARLPEPPVWLGAVFLASLVGAAWILRRGGRSRWLAPVGPVLALALILTHPFAPQVAPDAVELTAIDVGQAESLLLALPDGKTVVVDGGGFPAMGRKVESALDIGEDVVSPYLWSRSIRKLDAIVSTHGHEDHIDGLFALLENFQPAELWLSEVAHDLNSEGLRQRAEELGTRVVVLRPHDSFRFGGAEFEALGPAAGTSHATEEAANDDSLVLRVSYGRHSFLLTGDIESRVEQELAPGLKPVTVLKAAHHGSRTSSTQPLLDAAQPAFAVVSSGYENPYHFPHQSVLDRLTSRRSAVFRTDLHGLVTLKTDGRRMTVEAYRWPAPPGAGWGRRR